MAVIKIEGIRSCKDPLISKRPAMIGAVPIIAAVRVKITTFQENKDSLRKRTLLLPIDCREQDTTNSMKTKWKCRTTTTTRRN